MRAAAIALLMAAVLGTADISWGQATPVDTFESRLAPADRARESHDLAGERAALLSIVKDLGLASQWRSIAHLRLAQCDVELKDTSAALKDFDAIAGENEYPAVHRFEAQERRAELERTIKGLPGRDPELSRVRGPVDPEPGHAWYVSPAGDDKNAGSAEAPFATISKALEARRSVARTAGGDRIELAPGEYPIRETIALSKADSASADAPLVIRAKVPGTAILYGGQRISGFSVVTDAEVLSRLPEESRGKVMQCDLKAQGITDFGELAIRGFGQQESPPTLEVFAEGQPQTLARWPNQGFIKATKLLDKGDAAADRPSKLAYAEDRPARWKSASDGWLFGYFCFLWADAAIPMRGIDAAAHTVSTAVYSYKGRPMDMGQGIIFYAFNLLEEIDQPGEWYLDRKAGVLYWYPPSDPAKLTVELSMLPKTLLRARDVNHLRLEGIVFDCGRFNGIEWKNCSDSWIIGCTVQRMAGNGVVIDGGKNDTVLSSEIHTLGRRGSEISGGDRKTLTPGGHVVANCWFHDFGRIDRTYVPAIQLDGVGLRVVHNRFSRCPSSAMRLEGNDLTIEYNEFENVLQESDDQGVIDIFANPTYQGNVYRYNIFRDIGIANAVVRAHGQAGIRFDDAISGQQVYGNIFYRAARGRFGAIQINSGRDNIIDNNLIVDCNVAITGGYNAGNDVWNRAKKSLNGPPTTSPAEESVHYFNDLYLKKYPALKTIFDRPGRNYVWRNAFVKCGVELRGDPKNYDRLLNTGMTNDPGVIANDAIRSPIDPAIFKQMGLRPIPVDEIGLYDDPAGASWKK